MASGPTNSLGKVDVGEPETFKRQGSLRKVLPSTPNPDSPLSMSVKMIDRPTVSNRSNLLAYSQYQQEYSTISEYNMLRKQDLPGVYVIPSGHSSLVWFGVIFVRQGLYQGAVFRFNVYLPETFPDGDCPRVVFQPPVFHPMVHAETGEMSVRAGFPEWRKNSRVWQLLAHVRRVLYTVETRGVLNAEAAQLYERDPARYRARAEQCARESVTRVYDAPLVDDPHYIAFDPYDQQLHGPVRDAIFTAKDEDSGPSSIGLSWVQPGSLEPFSRSQS